MRKLLIVDPTLLSLEGHSYNYVHAICGAARGKFDAIFVYADREFRDPEGLIGSYRAELNRFRVDRLKRWVNNLFHWARPGRGRHASHPGHATVVPNVSGWMVRFAKWLRGKDLEWSLRRIVREHAAAGIQLDVFIQHAHFAELVLAGRLRSDAHLHLVLRYSPGLVNAGQMQAKEFQTLIARLDRLPRVHLYTDSERLSAEYAALGARRVVTLPVPILVPAGVHSVASGDHAALRVSFLGSARVEKGFCELPALIERLPRVAAGRSVVTMVQVNSDNADPRVRQATHELRTLQGRLGNRALELLESPVPMETYYSWVARASIAAMPYVSPKYRSSTSGIFVEALTFGVPVICPSDSWMADIVTDAALRMKLRIGQVVPSIDKIPEAEAEIASALPTYRADVRRFAEYWRSTHNADACVKLILEAAKP